MQAKAAPSTDIKTNPQFSEDKMLKPKPLAENVKSNMSPRDQKGDYFSDNEE